MARSPRSSTPSSGEEALLRRKVQQGSLVRALSIEPVALPPAQPPSLEQLEVFVPPPAPVTQEALLERFQDLRRDLAVRRAREVGEALAAGDEVRLDIIGLAGGRIIPFSVRDDWLTELSPRPALPGLFEGLVGTRVGEAVRLPVVLPADYPAPALRGVEAQFMVEVKAAWELTLPEEESPRLLEVLGGGSLEEGMASLARELAEEAVEAQRLEATQRVLDEVAERTRVELPEALVEEEIRRQWGRTEGRLLARRGVPPGDQEGALQSWLEDGGQRLEATRRLRIALGLKALVEREGLRLEEADVHRFLDEVAEALGMTCDEVEQAVKENRAVARAAAETALHLRVVEYVVERARIHLEGAPAAEHGEG
jgi:trigger factor